MRRMFAAATTGTLAVLAATAVPAEAVSPPPVSITAPHKHPADDTGSVTPGAKPITKTVYGDDDVCEAGRRADGKSGNCETVRTLTVSAKMPVSAADVARYGHLRAADGTTLAQAASSGTVWKTKWKDHMRGAYYYNWYEDHGGNVYFDGSHVWSNIRYRGLRGNHWCGLGSYTNGWSISDRKCPEYRRLSRTYTSMWDIFTVSAVAKGAPFSRSHHMWMHVGTHGKLTWKRV